MSGSICWLPSPLRQEMLSLYDSPWLATEKGPGIPALYVCRTRGYEGHCRNTAFASTPKSAFMDTIAARVELPRRPGQTEAQGRRKDDKRRSERRPPLEAGAFNPCQTPGLRDTLVGRLTAMGLPADKQVSFVADLTGCATQTVRRWLATSNPGLPDLRSFTRLCHELDISTDEVIGVGHAPSASGRAPESSLMRVARCVHGIARELDRRGHLAGPIRVSGDEMAPRLQEGDWVFLDQDAHFTGSGLYGFERKGEVVIRRVQDRVGAGWVLTCDNKAYANGELGEMSARRMRGLRLLGRVRGVIAVRAL